MLPYLDLNIIEKLVLKGIIKGSLTFPNHTVEEMVWGYDDELMKLAYQKKLAPYPKFGFFVNVSRTQIWLQVGNRAELRWSY